jgi:CubicO group peptidase (beta-lactamase class C family)
MSVTAGTAPGGSPLSGVDTWGASFAAAAAVDRTGTTHRHGDTTAVVRVASITKLCTAWAVLVAVEEGAVELDEAAGPPGSTVRHLLAHASGLDFDTPSVITEPGRRRIYSNSGYEALAALVAERTGMDFAEYLRAGVLAPLGMTASELRGSAAKDLSSDVEDLLTFAAELRAPRLLHPTTVADALTAQWPELAGVLPGWGQQDPCPWGLGPELRGTKAPHWTGTSASPGTFGHFGGSGTLLWIDPDAQVTCVALSDRGFGDWAVDAWPPFSDEVRAAYR